MATPTKLDIQAVKDAMAKTPGLNYVDAARQVRGVQNAPVAPTTPATPLVPTPTVTPAPVAPTVNVQEQMAGKTVAERQAIRSGSTTAPVQTEQDINKQLGGVIQPNGINSVQPLNAVTEMPASPKQDATPGITQDAFQQAQAKSAEIKAQNDAVMAQNKQKSDLAREDAALAAQAAIPTDKKGIVNAMVTGASIPVQKTEAYNKAVVTSDLFKKFSGMTSDQLFQNLQQGQIGTELSGLLASNPNFAIAKQKYEQVQKTNAINTQTNAMYNAANGKENTVVDELAKIESKYSAPPGTNAQAYEQFVTQDPDVVKSGLELKNLATQINTVTKTYNDALKSLKEQYPDMPASALITLMGTRTKDTKELLDSYISAKELAKGDFDLAMKMADGHYNAVSKDIAEQDQIEKEQRAIQAQKDMIQYEADFVKKQAEAALNDPAIAIKAVMDEMAKIGITSNESLQTKIQKANEFIANGGTIGGYIDEMKKLYTEKPEYKAYLQKQGGTEWQSTNITRYNPATGANESTPVFYRKKTDGSFEAVDLSGNKIDASAIGGGGFGTGTGTPGTIPTSFSGDTTSYIASKEGFRDTAYQDSAGVWTIGYGTTKINGKPIQPGQKITQADAQKQLGADIAKHSNWKNYIDESTLSPSQRTALASFEYNLGPGIWDKGAVNIINMVKSGDLAGAGKEMQKYVNAGGKVIKGLQNRRAEEAKLLQSTGTSETPSQTYDPNKIKSFEAFNGTTFPSDYKTPAQQKQFREEYDAWRASRPGTRIESGNDILNIKIDKPTEGQSASQSYTSRMLNAVNNLMPLEKKFLELGTGGQVAQTYLPSLLKSSDQKMMDAEKKNFITAVLRKQSGASIAPSEFAGEEMKYFPQPGDSKEVVIAKQNARNAEIKAMLSTAGVDAEGNSLSKYYNPPVITSETPTKQIQAGTDKITTLKKNYFK